MNTVLTYELLDWVDINKLNWERLSCNPNAIHLLEKNLDKVDWDYLSANSNAIHLLEKNLGKVNWCYLSNNPNAMHILEKNLHRIDWECLSENPNIFKLVYDYNAIKHHFESLHQELATLFYHPLRMNLQYTMFCSDDLEYDLQFDKPVISVLRSKR